MQLFSLLEAFTPLFQSSVELSHVQSVAGTGLIGLSFVLICCVYIVPLFAALVMFTFWVWMLIVVIQRDEATFSDSNGKLLWILIIVFTGIIGAGLYYFMEFRKET
ncbi:MAG: hypothetical protein TR69_WS6001000876 [candidate division WS6 bacterium OLB20]|uniref:Cardiolipin synthase N-terminal domain-containing protein n=1 Tax=candidate division WS6 bacterium OLB20 TaxID=1617426 RepID=A0A136LYY2_9BACT|nr:MAG: hypothetical protein TR69_WS6001000876 [candidate division WS6 bacterium OLB20]